MELLLRHAEGNLSDTERSYAERKLGRLERYFSGADRVELVHRLEHGQHVLTATVFAGGLTVRGEQKDSSARAAIDRLSDQLEERLKRAKDKNGRDSRPSELSA